MKATNMKATKNHLKGHCHPCSEISYFISMRCSLLQLRLSSCNRKRKMPKMGKRKEISTTTKKWQIKGLKFHQNGGFDFWTSCQKINCNPLPSLQSCTSTSKYLLHLVLWDPFIKFIRAFGGNWQYNEEKRK